MITAHKGVSERIYKSHLLASSSSCSILSHRGLLSCGPSCRALLAKVVGGKNYQYKAKLEWIREELEDGGIALCRRLINGDKAPHPSGYPFSLMTRQHNTTTAAATSFVDCWSGDGEDLLCCKGLVAAQQWITISLVFTFTNCESGQNLLQLFSNNEVFYGCHQSP